MNTGLEGKVVFITGGAHGIGEATALAFAREGAHVGIVDIDEPAARKVCERIAALGSQAHFARANARIGDQLDRSFDDLLEAFDGTVDVLVNNVGVGYVRTFDQITDAHWQETFEVNFLSYVRSCRKILPVMRERKHGVIVNNASDLARQPESNPIDYSSLKSAVLALTKGLARAEGPQIRINAVAPGPIWTPFWTKPGGFADTLGAVHKMPPQQAVEHELKLRQMPLARLGTPEEVANVIVFLASDLASFVTSSVWGVDGGTIRNVI